MRRRTLLQITANHRERAPAVPLGRVIELLKEGHLFRGAASRSALELAVAQALGPERSGHVQLGGVKGGKLVLFVDEPAYRYELQNYWYEPILQAVGREAPEAGVHELGFRLAARDGDHPNARQA